MTKPSASAHADYSAVLQASRDSRESYVDAVLERRRYQNGAWRVLLALLRDGAAAAAGSCEALRVSFKRGP